jgi:hypothetical protein
MNKKVITIIVVVAVVALCVVALIYAPNMMEFVMRMHRIPQH